jgi:hypothetical protein
VRNDVILVLVVITALSFDFTNGFHDTGNAMATSIATWVALIYWRSRGSKVDHNNVNAEWTGTVAPTEPEPAAVA